MCEHSFTSTLCILFTRNPMYRIATGLTRDLIPVIAGHISHSSPARSACQTGRADAQRQVHHSDIHMAAYTLSSQHSLSSQNALSPQHSLRYTERDALTIGAAAHICLLTPHATCLLLPPTTCLLTPPTDLALYTDCCACRHCIGGDPEG